MAWNSTQSSGDQISAGDWNTMVTYINNLISCVTADIDHDSLKNYVGNEHIDWTGAGAGTIHSSNYTDNDTTYSASHGLNLTGTAFSVVTSNIDHDTLKNFDSSEHIDWTNSTVTLNISSIVGNSMVLTPGDAGNSQSVGGALRITNTSNPGSAIVVYSNEDNAADGHLVQLGADNSAFDKSVLRVWNDGTSQAATFDNNNTSSTAECVSMTHDSADATTLGVNGNPDAKGVLKITHSGAAGDSGSSGLSIDLSGAGTAAKGIYVDATGGGTTGNLMQLRSNTSDKFVIDCDGNITTDPDINSFSLNGSTTFTSVSTGVADNDKLVTKGYVDDNDCPTYMCLKATAQAEGDLHLSGVTWTSSKANIKVIRVVSSSSDYDLYLLQNDNGHAANDANIPEIQLLDSANGNTNVYLDYPYEDEDDSDEVHIYYNDNAGADTADIYILGVKMK